MKKYQFADIEARPFPNILELKNPHIYGRAGVVINVSEKEYPDNDRLYLVQHGKTLWHLPLSETGNDMGLENIMNCIRILEQADILNTPVIVHCDGGNNRSRVVVECYHYRKMGFQLDDEYKGAVNHLIYNCSIGVLPRIWLVEEMIRLLLI